jgi:hypothetical protein
MVRFQPNQTAARENSKKYSIGQIEGNQGGFPGKTRWIS